MNFNYGSTDEFGLPDLGSLERKRAEMDETSGFSHSWGKEYGNSYSAPSYGDGYDSGPADFLPGAAKDRVTAEYYPGTVNARGASPHALVAPLLAHSKFGRDSEYTHKTPVPLRSAEETYAKYRGPNRLKGVKLHTGPMLNAAGMPEAPQGSFREGFATTGSRGTAPYPQARSRVFDVRAVLNAPPGHPVEYYKGTTPLGTTPLRRNPRSKDYVFNNKHGKLKVPDGVSLTSGTTITADGDYLVGNNRATSNTNEWGGALSAFSAGAVGIGVESVGNQYGGSMLHRENNTFNGFTKNQTTRCLDSRGSVQGVYMGPPDPEDPSVNIGGPPPPIGLRVPSIFKNPNKTMDEYHTNIAYIKDNPQIVEFYGANTFELMEDGAYGNYRPSTITASSKRNIVGEHYDDRLVDLRFNNEGTYQYALANGPGSTSRGVYLDMKTVKAMRPVLDYIFYLETGGRILPDETDDFYFVTEEQYFSTGPLDKDLVHYCSKRYNTGMIDVFKFLNYVFQYFFKRDPMVTADFRTYSKLINKFITENYVQ